MPCGIPNSFTYCGSSDKYFIGTAMNNNKIYETPSNTAKILKTGNNFGMVLNFVQKYFRIKE